MNETIILFQYEPQIKFPVGKTMLIKTIIGNYYIGHYDGKVIRLSDFSYLSKSTVITHYSILE